MQKEYFKSTLSPLVLFVYNRPWHTHQTIKHLQANYLADQTNLFIYSDGPKDVQDNSKIKEVRNYLNTITGFRKVTLIKREKNWGLAESIINGTTEIIDRYHKVIVLEDDLITSPNFLDYMNKALGYYQDNQRIYSISGYNHPTNLMPIPNDYQSDVYFTPRASSWGWATWRDRWEKADWSISDFDRFLSNKQQQKQFNQGGDDLTRMLALQMEGKIDSWAIRWCYTHYKNQALAVWPVKSYINNIGLDGTGSHYKGKEVRKYRNIDLNQTKEVNFANKAIIDDEIIKNFHKVYRHKTSTRFIKRLKNYIFPKVK